VGHSKARPKIGVSACLLGQKVRYDGRKKQHPAINQLSCEFELIPICPEVGAGLSVPRPPIQLVKQKNRLVALGVEERKLDVTAPLNRYFESQLSTIKCLSGLILKTKSPSCGIDSTPFFDFSGEAIGQTSGLFASGLQQYFPSLPLIDEEQFEKELLQNRFLEKVHQYHLLTRALCSGNDG